MVNGPAGPQNYQTERGVCVEAGAVNSSIETQSDETLINQPKFTEDTAPLILAGLVSIAEPENRLSLKKAIECCESLGETRDHKKIFLYRYHAESPVMNEIGRLREESFRLIGEGTGQTRDIDQYDLYYMHIVLWDEQDLEIVGAYRLCSTNRSGVLPGRIGSSSSNELSGVESRHLYTSSLFEYTDSAESILKAGLELGRSFVQPKYWGSRSLEYLWYGISAFLRRHPEYRYLFGAVSISNTLSTPAKDILIRYYQRYYGSTSEQSSQAAVCKRPYKIEAASRARIDALFDAQDRKEAFTTLKKQLRYLGFAVPVLYKQYAELSKPGGTQFLGFNIDPDFNDCVDGLVVVDINQMSELKRKRYGLLDHKTTESEALNNDRF